MPNPFALSRGFVLRRGGNISPPPAAAPITAVAADGWQATIAGTPPADYDPLVEVVGFTVQRAGFDGNGNAATLNDDAWINYRLRLAFPNQATKTADTCVLSDYIYAGDVISGVTNNSTKSYPDPICYWLQHDHFPIFDSTFTVDLAVAHKFARNGRPVAAVKIIASDGTTTRETLVNTLTFRSWAATGLGADVFSATFTSADFASATAITVDAIIYPWAGPAYQLSVNGLAAPNMKNTVVRGWRYPQVFVYLSTSGDDTAGVASENPATAAASPCLTIAGACTKLAAYNNATYGRNEVSGGTIRFPIGTWVLEGTGSRNAVTNGACLIYESINPADRATTILADNNVLKTSNNAAPRLLVRNVTLQKAGGNVDIIRNGNNVANVLSIDNCVFDRNGQTTYGAWLNIVGRFWATNNSLLNGNVGQYGNVGVTAKNMVLIGCDLSSSNAIAFIGCRMTFLQINNPANATLGQDRGLVYNCFITGTGGGNFLANFSGSFLGTPGPGYAIVGTVIENYSTSGAMRAWADGNSEVVYDFLMQNVTMPGSTVGQRFNRIYSDVAAATGPKQASVFSVVWPWSPCKIDIFAADGAAIGAWPIAFRVGHSWMTHVLGTTPTDSSYRTIASWAFAATSLGEQIGDGAGGVLDPLWVDDQTAVAGGGDYRPQSGSPLQRIPAGRAITARDMLGTIIPDDGTAFVGALQP